MKLFGTQQRGQGERHIVQDAGLGLGGRRSAALSSSQASFWLCGVGGGAGIAKDMGMAADHLVGDGRDHIAEIEQAGFLGHAGMKHDLEQKIAQFVRQGLVVLVLDAGGDFIGFLDGVGRDGLRSSARGPRDSHRVRAGGA